MGYVFNEFDKTLEMVEGAYKKLKAHLYFDKTLLFLKKRLCVHWDRDSSCRIQPCQHRLRLWEEELRDLYC